MTIFEFPVAFPSDGAMLVGRVYRHYRRNGLSQSDALLVTRFILYSKFAHVLGIARYYWNFLRGEFRIIEYK